MGMLKTMRNLDMNARKVIYELTSNDETLKNSVLADDYPNELNKPGFYKILPTGPLEDGYSYIFIRLKTTGGPRNLTVRYDARNKIEIFDPKPRSNNQKISGAMLFELKSWGSGRPPDIYFFDSDKKKTWKAIEPPFNILIE
jgi:hypothetical protein